MSGHSSESRAELARTVRLEPRAADARVVCDALGLIEGPRCVRRQAAGLVIRCPVHDDRTPSCSVRLGSDGTLAVRCHACGFSADAIGLVQAVRRCTFRDAILELAQIAARWDLIYELDGRRVGAAPAPLEGHSGGAEPPRGGKVHLEKDTVHRVYSAVLDLCPLRGQPDVLAYAEARGIRADAEAVGCGALPRMERARRALIDAVASLVGGFTPLRDAGLLKGCAEPSLSWPGHRLLIPWRSRAGQYTSLQRRLVDATSRPKYVFPPRRAPEEPFGIERLASVLAFHGPDCEIILAEGALDALARQRLARHRDERAAVLGVRSASCPSAGLPHDLLAGRRIVLALDSDEAGEAGCAKLAQNLSGIAREFVRERPVAAKDWAEAVTVGFR